MLPSVDASEATALSSNAAMQLKNIQEMLVKAFLTKMYQMLYSNKVNLEENTDKDITSHNLQLLSLKTVK